MAADLYIGLMSGTSLDGVDGVLADFSANRIHVLAHANAPFTDVQREELQALNTRGGPDELHRAQLAANALMRTYAQVVESLLAAAGFAPADVTAIGAHGQTVRHRPGEFDGTGYTVQLCNPALLAELTDIDVVADFRTRDVAAGGQGAPLAPFFHRAVFSDAGHTTGVLNVGGISNLSVLRSDGSMLGFDCGPGNGLMDAWCASNLGLLYDDGGAWAASGRILPNLLRDLLQEPYFAKRPPKSTGRDLFNVDWLQSRLQRFRDEHPADVQATLVELTAQTIAADVRTHGGDLRKLVVCGGGALNSHLMRRLQAALPGVQVETSDALGLPALQVEACAFAWLARKCVLREPLPLESVTGARGARVLGAVWPR